MIEINEWFQGNKNFQKGKKLYDKYGNDDSLKKLFQKGKCAKSQIILDRALHDILSNKSLEKVVQKADKRAHHTPKPTPELIKPLVKKKNDLYVVARNLHSKLIYASTKEERYDLAYSLLQTWDAVNAIWSDLNYFDDHGKLPPKKIINNDIVIKADVHDLIDLYERYKTLASYISKARKKNDTEKEKKAITESNMIADIINLNYGFEKIKRK